jgi:hypothetical protein
VWNADEDRAQLALADDEAHLLLHRHQRAREGTLRNDCSGTEFLEATALIELAPSDTFAWFKPLREEVA